MSTIENLNKSLTNLSPLLWPETRSIHLRLGVAYSLHYLLVLRNSNGDFFPFHHQHTYLFPSSNGLINCELGELLLLLSEVHTLSHHPSGWGVT